MNIKSLRDLLIFYNKLAKNTYLVSIETYKKGKDEGWEVEKVSSTANHSVGEICIVCEQRKEKGIRIYTQFLCVDCEKEIIQTETDDPKYRFYLQQLKKITNREIYS